MVKIRKRTKKRCWSPGGPSIFFLLERNKVLFFNHLLNDESFKKIDCLRDGKVITRLKHQTEVRMSSIQVLTQAIQDLERITRTLRNECEAMQAAELPPSPIAVNEAESNPPPAMVGGGSNCDSDPPSTKPWGYRLAAQSHIARIQSEIDAGTRIPKTPSVSAQQMWKKNRKHHPNNSFVKNVIAVLASGGDMSKEQIIAMSNLTPRHVKSILRELDKQTIAIPLNKQGIAIPSRWQ